MTKNSLLAVGLVALFLAAATGCASQQGDEEDEEAALTEGDDGEEVGEPPGDAASALSSKGWTWAKNYSESNGCTVYAGAHGFEIMCPIATDKKVFSALRNRFGKKHVGRTSKQRGYMIVLK
jgi:hypothetical protein